MLTSSREERDVEEAYRPGANSYGVKPVELDAFARPIEQGAAQPAMSSS
jgi:hypothetical protein